MRYNNFALLGNGLVNTTRAQFNWENAPIFIVSEFSQEDRIFEIFLKIISPFSSGTFINIGFPANQSEIATVEKINPQEVCIFKFLPYKIFTTTETLTIYISGFPVVGVGEITVYHG